MKKLKKVGETAEFAIVENSSWLDDVDRPVELRRQLSDL
jgi:hypothetical protein